MRTQGLPSLGFLGTREWFLGQESGWSWTASQRRALVAILASIAVGLGIEIYLRPVYVSDPLPAVESRSGEIAGRINPNTAAAAELSSIPQVGPSRAAAIIAYREQYVAANPGKPAFTRPEDLRNVKGFGAAMVENVEGYLEFGGGEGE